MNKSHEINHIWEWLNSRPHETQTAEELAEFDALIAEQGLERMASDWFGDENDVVWLFEKDSGDVGIEIIKMPAGFTVCDTANTGVKPYCDFEGMYGITITFNPVRGEKTAIMKQFEALLDQMIADHEAWKLVLRGDN